MPFLSRTILAAGLLAFGVLPSLAAAVEPDSGNALGLLDAYLSQAADETPPFRTDLEPRAGSAPVPSGRRSGLGSVLGPFTYRPKTYRELTPAERSDLLRDPKFRAFLERTVRPEEPSARWRGQGDRPGRRLPGTDSRQPPLHCRARRNASGAGLYFALPNSVNAAFTPPVAIDPQHLLEILNIVHEQVSTALWLSAGMVCAVGAIVALAVGFRRIALVGGCFYSLSLCFVHNGHAQVLGPIGCAAALTGLLWPRGRKGPPSR